MSDVFTWAIIQAACSSQDAQGGSLAVYKISYTGVGSFTRGEPKLG